MRQEPMPHTIQIGESQQREDPRGVLGRPPVADLGKAPQPFDHKKGIPQVVDLIGEQCPQGRSIAARSLFDSIKELFDHVAGLPLPQRPRLPLLWFMAFA